MRHIHFPNLAMAALGALLAFLLPGKPALAAPDCDSSPTVCVASLSDLGVPALRERSYASSFTPLQTLAPSPSVALMLAYSSDGLRLYARLDLPASAASGSGYPLVVLAPGWIGRDAALTWNFAADTTSATGSVRAGLVEAGFAVLTVGYRGRGTVNDVPADGMVFRDAWGNGSYLSPVFYAIDVLNALAGLHTLNDVDWTPWLGERRDTPLFDLSRVALWGHSQGGDVASMVLAVSGDNPRFPQTLAAASIWSGNIPDRLTQANTFRPMGSATQAFMSGDGTWTGSARGRDGRVNPDFVFPWPADWIGTLDRTQWTWQAEQWSQPSVASALESTYREMYDTLNRYVLDMQGLDFAIARDASGRSVIEHAGVVAREMPQIGAYHQAGSISTPLALHASDRDYYSLPEWNRTLASRVRAAGGSARVYIYPGTNHALRRSAHDWFSPPGTEDGAARALARDIALFNSATLPD